MATVKALLDLALSKVGYASRFWSKVEFTPTCWLWTSACTAAGYGQFSVGGRKGKKLYAHRLAYEMLVGPIPEGLHIDHLCRVRHCVNPAHLEPVTCAENIRRGRKGVLTTHCPRGHPYDEANTRWKGPNRTMRDCRACVNERRWEKGVQRRRFRSRSE